MDEFYQDSIDKLDELLQESKLPWWEWNVQKNLTRTNGLKEKMLGYDPKDFQKVGYEAYTNLLHADDYERAMQAMRDCLEGKKPIYQVDYRIRKADGDYTWYMDRGRVVKYTDDGKPHIFRGLIIDMGEEIKKNRESLLFAKIRSSLPQNIKENLVICSVCKKYKVERNTWLEVNKDMLEVFSHDLSHGICPDCMRKLYPEYAEDILGK